MSRQESAGLRINSTRPGLGTRIADLWRYRELLVGLVRTELKVKYKNSTLGFLWSMLNPALYLVVYYVVFQIILGSGIPFFPIFLLSGLLVWNLFFGGVAGATGSVVGGGALVKKIYFPREILPLASIGAALTHFFFQSIVLVLALAIFRYSVAWEYMPLLIPALAILLVFGAALGLFLSATNVYLRDTSHLLELVLLAWFWMTPIVYPFRLVADRGGLLPKIYELNPIVWIVITFQRALYNQVQPTVTVNGQTQTTAILPDGVGFWYYAGHLAVVGVVACVLFVLAMKFFSRVDGNFAEEL